MIDFRLPLNRLPFVNQEGWLVLSEWNDLLGSFLHCAWRLGQDDSELDGNDLQKMQLICQHVLKGALQDHDHEQRINVKKMRFLTRENEDLETISISFVFDGLKYSRYSYNFDNEPEFTPVPMALTFISFSIKYDASAWDDLSCLVSQYIDYVILSMRHLQTKLMITSDTWLSYCGNADLAQYQGIARDFVYSVDSCINFWFVNMLTQNQKPIDQAVHEPSLEALHSTLPLFDEAFLTSVITMFLCAHHLLFISEDVEKILSLTSILRLLSKEPISTNIIGRFEDLNFAYNITGFVTGPDFDLDSQKSNILKAPFSICIVDLRSEKVIFPALLKSQFFNIRNEYLRQLVSDSLFFDFSNVFTEKRLCAGQVTKIVFLLSQVTDMTIARTHLANWHTLLKCKALLVEKTVNYIYEKYQRIVGLPNNDSIPSISASTTDMKSPLLRMDLTSQSGNSSPLTVILDSENQSTRSTPLHSRIAQYQVQTNTSNTTASSRVPSPSLSSEMSRSQILINTSKSNSINDVNNNESNRKQSGRRMKARRKALANELMSSLCKICACPDINEARRRGRSMASDNFVPARPSSTDNSARQETSGYYETFKGIFKTPVFHWLSMDGPWNYSNAQGDPESREHADKLYFSRLMWGDQGIKSSYKHELETNADLLLMLSMAQDPLKTAEKLLEMLCNSNN